VSADPGPSYDPRLVVRSELREDDVLRSEFLDCGLVEAAELGAQDDVIDIKANVAANLACDQVIVAREDLDRDAVPAECP
jgi:hypothetical protein